MINLDNIQSLTDFKRNASSYVDRIRETKSPLVLTVNGKAAVVVQDATAFQASADRMESMETQIQALMLAALKQDIQVGIQQLENGQYQDYNEEELDTLFEDIQREGRQSLGIMS
jgi:prevent-host-death family protein